jgi:extracellular factor (EF) 3-hydroxypalmitic acid methyl ester biosynthesis protein
MHIGTAIDEREREDTRSLHDLRRQASDLGQWASAAVTDPAETYSQYVALVHALIARLRRCEVAGCGHDAIAAAVVEARRVHRLSPLCTRLQDWPRGYAGDFETVEYLCDAVNRAPVDSVGHAIEGYALRSTAAQQHRNKVDEQAAVIARRLEEVDGEVRLLSLGCGGSRDLVALRRQCASPAALRRLHVVLNDSDPHALDLSERRLATMGMASTTLPMNVLTALRSLARERVTFDLVLAGGLFDYLDDRAAAFAIEICRRLLRPRGVLFFTNIATGNPYRPWMEHVASWRLLHRTEADIHRLVARPDGSWTVTCRRDVSQLALLATVARE